MTDLADALKGLLAPLEAKHGPVSTWATAILSIPGTTPTTSPCPTCWGQGWVSRPQPNPNASIPIYRAAPCPDCLTGRESPAEESGRLWRLSGISDAERQRCTFDRFDVDAVPSMRPAAVAAAEWATGRGQPILVLHGPKGSGKTHLALAAAATCIARGEAVRYAIAPLLLDELRATQRPYHGEGAIPKTLESVRRRYETYPAVVLDDLGAGRQASEFAEEQLYVIVNERWRQRLRTLVTTNVDPNRLEERTRSRLFDRATSRVVAAAAPDYRLGGKP